MLTNEHESRYDSARGAELVAELAASTGEAARAARQSTRLIIQTRVVVDRGSLSERTGKPLHGITGDISSGGTQLLLPRPLLVGDVYHLSFDRSEVDIAPVYALCLRGRQVRSDAFEAGLRFLEPVELPVGARSKAEDLL
ncbi:MAG: PilZ domain-containing protein [Phycisphaerales bacterium]|jgi:hypothetical protein